MSEDHDDLAAGYPRVVWSLAMVRDGRERGWRPGSSVDNRAGRPAQPQPGKRTLTEQLGESHYAASGGALQRAYPWSNLAAPLALDGRHASYFDSILQGCMGVSNGAACRPADIVRVGTKPGGEGRWGHSDLGGNVFEWILDWDAPYKLQCDDCAELTPASQRVSRGGSWRDDESAMRAVTKGGLQPAYVAHTYGVRCARSRIAN